MHRSRAPSLLLLAVLLWPSPARAQESGDDARITEGVQLRSEGRDLQALQVFREVYAASPTPRALAQIGLAEQALGRWIEAEADLERALAQKEDGWVTRHRGQLDAALAIVQHHLGWVAVESSISGAELWIDGERAASLPRIEPLRAVAGAVVLEVRAAGYDPLRRTIEVEPGGRAQERFVLVPSRAAPSPPVDPPRATSPSAAPPRLMAWVTGLTGITLVAGGAVANVVRESNAAVYNDPKQCAPPPGKTVDDVCGGRRRAVNIAEGAMIVGYAAGGAALLASAILFATSAPRRTRSVALRCGLGGAPFGVACGGEF
jgi:hypothetical protein